MCYNNGVFCSNEEKWLWINGQNKKKKIFIKVVKKVGGSVQKYLEKAKNWLKSDNCWQKIKKRIVKKEETAASDTDVQQQKKEKKEWVLTCESHLKSVKGAIKDGLGYAVYYASPYRKYIIAGCSGAALLAVFVFCQAFSIGYVVSASGEPIFTVLDEKAVYETVGELETNLKKDLGVEVDLLSEVQVERSLVRDSKTYSEEQIQTCLEEKLGGRVNAVAITVDGTPKVYVPDRQTAETVLETLKTTGATVAEGEVLKDLVLKEDVQIEECQVAVRNLKSADAALEFIRLGEEKPVIYTVESGDTLWTIARENDMYVDNITTVNQINENAILSIGQELILSKSEPLISVVATVERQETESIPFETELKEDNSVNGIKITQEGENGEKVVSYTATRVNGVTTEEVVTGETVTKEAKNRIVVRGNQVTLASRGITQSAGVYAGGVRLTYPTQGTITQYFGRHTGIDIANRIGTSIVSAGDGIVTYVHYSNYSYGNYVVVDHLNGIVTRYAHCNEIFVSTGQSVKAGETIASMGNTGNSTGPHLHFEVLVNGAFVNPFAYL